MEHPLPRRHIHADAIIAHRQFNPDPAAFFTRPPCGHLDSSRAVQAAGEFDSIADEVAEDLPDPQTVPFEYRGNLGLHVAPQRHPFLLRISEVPNASPFDQLWQGKRFDRAIQLAGGHALGFSPDGRWLLLAGATVNDLPAQQPAGVSETLLYRLADGVTRRYLQDSPIYFFGFSGFDWSAGGDWLLLNLGQNIPLALIAPDDDYVYVPPLDLRQCLSSVWMAP